MRRFYRLIPGKMEVSVFAAAAFICAGIACTSSAKDLALSAASILLFVGCALMGMHRNGQLRHPWGLGAAPTNGSNEDVL